MEANEIHFLFYCKFYQNSRENLDFVKEFGLNREEIKSLPAEEKWKIIWKCNDIKTLQILAKFVCTV